MHLNLRMDPGSLALILDWIQKQQKVVLGEGSDINKVQLKSTYLDVSSQDTQNILATIQLLR